MKQTLIQTIAIISGLIIGMIAADAFADNYTFSQGSGKTAGSDTISSIDYPRQKIIIGADGVNDGDVSSANPMPVKEVSSATGTAKAEDSVHGTSEVGAFVLGVAGDGSAFAAVGDYVPFGLDTAGRMSLSPNDNGGLVQAEDSAHVSADPGVMCLAVRSDGSTLAGTLGDYSPIAVDSTGAVRLGDMSTGTTSIGKTEDSAHTHQDSGVFTLGVVTTTSTGPTSSTSGDYAAFALDATSGALLTRNVTSGFANDPAKVEDTVASSGDGGFAIFGVTNEDSSALSSATNDDYAPISVDRNGNVFTLLSAAFPGGARGNFVPRFEDEAAASTDAGMPLLSVREDTLTNTSGTTGDYTHIKSDSNGRVYVNTFGSDPSEFWSSCSSSNTGTSDVVIKAAVASNRNYITSLSCFNTATVASSITFKGGSVTVYAAGIGNSTLNGVAHWEHTLVVPIFTGVNEAFNFAMGTTATATTCCAAGFISPN